MDASGSPPCIRWGRSPGSPLNTRPSGELMRRLDDRPVERGRPQSLSGVARMISTCEEASRDAVAADSPLNARPFGHIRK
jgi:hypothetical protein